MKTTITETMFKDAFAQAGRQAVAEALNEQTSVVGTTSAGTVIFQAY